MTNYICPVCGSPLEGVSYTSKGSRKTKLWCSDAIARMEADHKAVVYYPSGKSGYWSFGLKAKPIAVGGDDPPTVNNYSANDSRSSKSTSIQPKRSRRRPPKRRNRQRQLSL